MVVFGTFGLSSKEEEVSHKFTVGSSFGLNLNTADFKNLGNANTCCEAFNKSFGTGLNFALGYGYMIDESLMLSLGADYTNHNSDFVVLQNESIGLDGVNKRDARIEQKVISKLNSVGINLLASVELFENFDAGIGYRLGIPSDINYNQTEVMLEPNDGVFQETNSRIRTKESGTLPSNLSHSIVSKLAYRINTSADNSTYISPNVRLDVELNSINDEMNLRTNSINLGVDFTYSITQKYNETDTEKKNRTNFSNNRYAEYDLMAVNNNEKDKSTKVIIKPVSSDINNKRQDSNQIVIDELKSIRMVPLLNYIFFDKDSSAISMRYKTFTKKDSYNFHSNNLTGVDNIEIYHQLLNIIGERMNINSKSELKIVGTVSKIEKGTLSKSLAIERAKTVRNYLVNTWGVDIKRLSINSIEAPYIPSIGEEEDVMEENQRVEFYTSDEDLLNPLLLQDTLYSPITKDITFYTLVDTNVKIVSWQFSVFIDNNNSIFESNGNSIPPLTTHLVIDDEISLKIKSNTELTYRFDLQPKSGENESVTGKFPININSLSIKEKINTNDIVIGKYSLIQFEAEKAEIHKKNMDMLDEIKKNITKESQIIISGFSDFLGDAESNKGLSKKRTESVSKVLKDYPNKVIYNYGESILLHNNNIPEGRFYSRAVEIKTITPIRK